MIASIREAVMGKPPPTLREMKRENKRTSRRAARDIGRQMGDIERREAELVKGMKAACKKGDHKMSKALSLDVVRLRRTKAKVAGARSAQMSLESTINNSLNGAHVAECMQEGMQSMHKMSAGMNPMQVKQMGARFATEMDKMEVMDEVLDDVMSAQAGDCSEDEDEEASQLMNEVLHGIAMASQMPVAGSAAVGAAGAAGSLPYQMHAGGPEQAHCAMGDAPPPPPPPLSGDDGGGGGGGGGGKHGGGDFKTLDLEERLRRLTDLH